MKGKPGIKSIFFQVILFLLVTTNLIAQNSAISVAGPTVTITGKVTSINQKSRKVKLKTDDGQWHIFTANADVKNLAQVKKGDSITVVYTESVVYQVRKQGSLTGVDAPNAAATGTGANTGSAGQQQTTITATITAIDPGVPSITFWGPDKETQTIKVKDPRNLDGVKVGDVVDITYTDAIAIKVIKSANK